MIKNLLLLFVACLITGNLIAQNRGNRGQGSAPLPPPVPVREVSGIVRDTADNSLIGATVTLTSAKDTFRTATNADGIFVFKNVKMATFYVSITEVGFTPSTRKYLQNDAVKRIVLEPIVLKSSSKMMGEVKINGTPSITYKIDTVEYRATDYKVRDNATVDELLKKMEGFEVGSDGSVTHQGQPITKAKLNGKDYAGGNLAQAIQNLPADIVEKIQVVDDYGDAAARTGVKDGDPQKVLNITTKADRSIGTTGRVTGQYGSNDRYNASVFALRINANQQISVVGRLQNTVNGVVSSGIAGGATNGGGGGSGVGSNAGNGGSGGTTKSGQPSFNYRDQWSKKIQVNGNYSYNFSDVNSISNIFGKSFTALGTNNFTNSGVSQNDSKGHTVNFEMDYSIDSANYLQINPTFSYNGTTSSRYSNNLTLGIQNQYVTGLSASSNSTPNFGTVLFYQHLFKKPKRNISFQVSVNRSESQANSETNNNTIYYSDSTIARYQTGDTTRHYLINRSNINTTYRASMTYVEPLGKYSQFEFNGQVRNSNYDAKAITDTVLANGSVYELTERANIYKYSFTEGRATFNYRFTGVKNNLSIGTTLVPTILSGTKVNSGNNANISTERTSFRIIPVLRYSYSWTKTERFTFTYAGTNTEPSFQQIQPFTDISNKQNPVVGNPDLKPQFTHSISAQYNNYLANSKVNVSFGVNTQITDNQIVVNTIQIRQNLGYINETHYVNLDGSHAVVARYNISKQLDDRKYNLSLNGNVSYKYDVSMSNNNLYNATNWRFDERFGPRINPTESIEINPYIGYDVSRSFFTFPGQASSIIKTVSLAVDGKMYFFKTYLISYTATKNYIDGLPGLTTNPFVINAGFEKEFLKKRNLVVTFNVFDILHQNNFVQQTTTQNSVTNTQSNALSRYFLLGLRLNLQKWSGSPSRNGKKMMRRGDGSFIY